MDADREFGAITDAALWTLLRDELADDRVPSDVRTAARESLSWRDPDSALAVLVADSAVEDGDLLAHVRGAPLARLLTFEVGELTVEVEVAPEHRERRLIGQLVPPAAARVAVDHAGGVSQVRADELGRFQVGGLGTGPARLRCVIDPAGPAVRTDWFLL
jgi:hypothetical protein